MSKDAQSISQIEKKHLINLYYLLSSFNLKDTNIKTAYWISKNIRILIGFVRDYENLRKELTETPVFLQYKEEISTTMKDPEYVEYMRGLEFSTTDQAKSKLLEKYSEVIEKVEAEKIKINEKYNDVIVEADKELNDFLEVKANIPEFYKISINDLDGIDSTYVHVLYDLIESD